MCRGEAAVRLGSGRRDFPHGADTLLVSSFHVGCQLPHSRTPPGSRAHFRLPEDPATAQHQRHQHWRGEACVNTPVINTKLFIRSSTFVNKLRAASQVMPYLLERKGKITSSWASLSSLFHVTFWPFKTNSGLVFVGSECCMTLMHCARADVG